MRTSQECSATQISHTDFEQSTLSRFAVELFDVSAVQAFDRTIEFRSVRGHHVHGAFGTWARTVSGLNSILCSLETLLKSAKRISKESRGHTDNTE
jgi:hypothetical protein